MPNIEERGLLRLSVARFRPQAVQAYNAPDAVGGVLQFPPPSGFRLLAVLGTVFAVIVGVASQIEVPVVASGPGLIQSAAGVFPVQSAVSGEVTEVLVAPGTHVKTGQRLFTVRSREDEHAVHAHRAALVDHVAVANTQTVVPGQLMAELVPSTGVVGYLALDAEYRNVISRGDEVELHFREHSGRGRVTAQVLRIRESLLTTERAQELLAQDPPSTTSFVLELTIADPTQVSHGLPFVGEVVIQRQTALSLVLPFLRR